MPLLLRSSARSGRSEPSALRSAASVNGTEASTTGHDGRREDPSLLLGMTQLLVTTGRAFDVHRDLRLRWLHDRRESRREIASRARTYQDRQRRIARLKQAHRDERPN